MQRFGQALQDQPDVVKVLRARSTAFGLDQRPALADALADAKLQRAISGLIETAEINMRTQLQQRLAQAEAVQKRQEMSKRQASSQGLEMNM